MKLSDALAARQPEPGARIVPGVITAVAAGAAADNAALATVTVLGAPVQAPYLASYTPVVGHTVAVLYVPPAVLILGRPVGTPPT